MKTNEKIKRPVGRPATGIKKIRIDVNLLFETNNKLIEYAKKNNTTKSKIIEQGLEMIFEKM